MLPRMGNGSVDVTASIRAPIARVFERLSDHEGMSKWPGIGSSRLIREGTPKNGLGAMRRVKVQGFTIDEEIVHFEPPTGFDYSIRRGLPVEHHLGQVRLEEADGIVVVTWSIRLSSKIPLFAQLLAASLRRGLPKALAYLRAELEGAGP